MSVNKATIAALKAIARQPLQQQLDFLPTVWTTNALLKASWDPEPAVWNPLIAQAYLQRLAIEQTAKLTAETSRLTKWLIALTGVLVILTAVLVFGPAEVKANGLGFLRWLWDLAKAGQQPGLRLHSNPNFVLNSMPDAITWWSIVLAVVGTISQIYGSRLSEQGTPADDPWASLRGDDYLSQEPTVRAQAQRWRDRAWGTALGLTGTMLLLASVMVALLTTRLPGFAAWVLIVCPLAVAAWSLERAWRQSRESIKEENETVDYLHSIGKG